MRMKYYLLIAIFLFNTLKLISQNQTYKFINNCKILKYELENSPFPHPLRENGYKYRDKLYPFSEHYSDRSAYVVIPDNLKKGKPINLVFYFHGWYNNIDSIQTQFNLVEQFCRSKIEALLVLVETAKNAPDSFGGKLEEKNIFKLLVEEIVKKLNNDNDINTNKINKIILSGHSGAYRVISFILNRGGMTKNISEVILFDGLYGQTEKYVYWLTHYSGKFINIYTEDGGTKAESELLINDLNDWNIKNIAIKEDELTDEILRKNRIISIYSEMGHNDVISKRDNFYRFLINSSINK